MIVTDRRALAQKIGASGAYAFGMANGIQSWKDKALAARRALARTREAIEGAVPHARHDGEVIGAAIVAGAVRGSFEATGKDYSLPGPGGAKIPPELVGGLLLEALAFSRQTEVSDDLHALGSGVLAYIGGREAELYMRTRQRNGGGNGAAPANGGNVG